MKKGNWRDWFWEKEDHKAAQGVESFALSMPYGVVADYYG